ncbi:sterol desaturase family protein [Thalassotalea sp. PP2-459]|uniref:sterol desaturase family protein n=1 Tax=Thalassotalea sp. PP2-459 TaxID=1742724 RepID=UPI000942ABF1|nr:sterol desaturase family protein [Thalassotalea sp. PP2-459]OKY26964.1 fatty acid hydroxylase [Thalassotalea sp. PP2-459]
MPTPIEILIDPLSLMLLSIYATLIVVETIHPGQPQKKVKGWIPKTMFVFIIYFYLSTYLPLIWDKYLLPYQLMNLQELNPYISTLMALLVFELMIYLWHRAMHSNNWLWRTFHQMHHSAERLDTFGAFYFSPLDMIGFTFIGSLTLSIFVGLSPQAISWFLYITMFLAIFQHTNIKTPQWLGYIIQRPESHSVHHQKGIHRYNYSDLPIFDILFGTFNNPKEFSPEIGFYNGCSSRVKDALLFKDISKVTNR